MIPLENSLKIKSYPFVSFAFAVLMDSKMINSSEWICINVNIYLMETIDKPVPKKIWINVWSIVYARIVSEWGKQCGFDTFSSVTRELDPFIHGTLFIKCLYFRLSFFTLFLFPGIHRDMISAHMPFACIILRNKIIFLKLLSSLEIYFLFVYVFFYQKSNWWQLKEKLKRRQRKWQAVYIWILCCMEHTV